jgi:hypothetical protein
VNLTESTLAFGRAEEPSPKLERIRLADVAEDVVENERLTSDHATDEACITYTCDVPGDLVLRADPEQLHRVLSNLLRNARQAIAATGKPGEIRISGLERDGSWRIEVSRHRARPAEKGARSPVPTVPWRRAQGWHGPRPRHRGRNHPRPWRRARTGGKRTRRDDLRDLPSRGPCSRRDATRKAPRIPLAPLRHRR